MLATKSNSYTFQKDGIWYFSRRVPADLRRHYRTGRIAYSLRLFATTILVLLLNITPSYLFAWTMSADQTDAIPSCQMIQTVNDGTVILEASKTFQGIAFITESAASLEFEDVRKSQYGNAIAIWSDENPAIDTYAWHDLRGIYISLSQGKWINMWEAIPGMIMTRGDELRISVGHEGGWPNNPDLSVPLLGFKENIGEFAKCLSDASSD